MSRKLAVYTSYILGPHLWLPVLIIILLYKSGLSSNQLKILFPSLFFLEVIIPLFYIYLAVEKKWVSAWDLPKREERYHFATVMIFAGLLSLIMVFFFGNQFLFTLMLTIFFLSSAIALITLFWKISIHSCLNTLAAFLINYLFSWHYLWLFLTIPLIFWARLYLKRHNLAQLVGGIVVTVLVLLMGLSTLPLPT